MREPLTPLEALKQLQPLFPWAKYIMFSTTFIKSSQCPTGWTIYENKPDLESFTSQINGEYLCFNYTIPINIEHEGDWKDSLFTTAKEGE